MTFELPTPEATEALGERVGALVRAGDVVCLYGELGAGKTTFARGVHAALRCEGRVRSPSFTTLIEHEGAVPLHHFDLYRYEAAGAGFFEEFGEWLAGRGVALIEWSERFGERAPEPRLEVHVAFTDRGRRAELRGVGGDWQARLASWGRA